jgi:hypothetical protein
MAILTGAVSDNFVLRLRGQRHVLLYCDIFFGDILERLAAFLYANILSVFSPRRKFSRQRAMARRSGGVDSAVTNPLP